MTTVRFHNQSDPNEVWSKDALDSNIGKELPLTNTITGETGTAKIIDVEVDDTGVMVTYVTDMNMGMRLDHFSIEEDDLQIVTPLELPDE